ncbi:hypothetical protein [Paraburkholderia sp. Cy-641]|uniref:hypothetical protein n=1 Tax=Paraburkholderia sp. Cy-641 TaxID=2608337 RepID=UPI001F03EFEF|nr:hypothetical protein [Paraburkholderia sp. Cy-641]
MIQARYIVNRAWIIYRSSHEKLDVSQATAAAQPGGVLSPILKAEGGAFTSNWKTRTAGVAVLVTSNNRRPRAFRPPAKTLEVIRGLGLPTG